MKHRNAFFIVAISTLIFGEKILADCDHCYTMAQARVEYNNKTKETIYIPIYNGYWLQDAEYSTGVDVRGDLTGVNILNIFKPLVRQGKIPFVRRIYWFKGIRPVVCKQEVDSLLLSHVTKIVFIRWIRDFSGAMSMAALPRTKIVRLQSRSIVCQATSSEGLSDVVYVNQNKAIPENAFILLIKHQPANEDSYRFLNDLYNELVISRKRSTDVNYNQKEALLSKMKQVSYIAGQIADSLNIHTRNETLNNTLQLLRSQYLDIAKVMDSSVRCYNSDDTIAMRALLDTVMAIYKENGETCEAIKEAENRDNFIFIISRFSLDLLRDNRKVYELFNKFITENDVIKIEYGWD